MPAKNRTRGKGAGSVYQRTSDGLWVGAVNLGVVAGKRERHYVYAPTEREAEKKLRELLNKHDRGEKVKQERQTVETFLNRWHADVITPRCKPNTIRTYRAALDKHILPALGDRQLAKLSPADVQRFLADLTAKGLAPATVASMHSTLHLALNQAMRWELVTRNVAGLVDRPKVPTYEPNPLTPEEAGRLLAHVASDRLAPLYEVSVRLGPRQAEALGLRWHDVDLDIGRIHIRHQLQRVGKEWQFLSPKTEGSRRSVELSPRLVDALRRHRETQDLEHELAGTRWQGQRWQLVFCTRIGTPLDPRTIGGHLHAQLAAAELQDRRWHDLRHTAATLMLAAGVPERVIMEILGHTTMSLTRRYAAVLPPARRDAIDRVDGLLERAVGPQKSEWLQQGLQDILVAESLNGRFFDADAEKGRGF